MTIQDLGNIGEFVAAAATLATLVYLAVQIRRNTLAVRAASHHAVSDSLIALNSWFARDPSLARIYRVGVRNLDDLTEDERIQFAFALLGAFRAYETIYYQHSVGTIEEPLFRSVERDIAFSLRYPGIREWWEKIPASFSPEFRSYVDAHVPTGDKAAV